jgi:hypothetical protein
MPAQVGPSYCTAREQQKPLASRFRQVQSFIMPMGLGLMMGHS